MAKPKTNGHPHVLDPEPPQTQVGQRQEIPQYREPDNWRNRFRDVNGRTLPEDGTRIDVKTGERIERLK